MNAAHGIQSLAWLLVALPAASAAVLLLAGKRADRWGHLLGAAVPVVLFVYTVVLFFSIKSESGAGGERLRNLHLFSWVPVGGFQVDAGFLLDPLSLIFCLLITGVGSLIHIYAVGYMAHDPGRRRFFGYFNLFVAAMLLLVLGNSYLALYVGWEGVGLASYLLIGFYYTRPEAATAAKKAFIANRVGDVGLSVAIMLMFAYARDDVVRKECSAGIGRAWVTPPPPAIGLMLLLGACGKSGQFPLAGVAPGRHGGSDPGLGPDPRGHDGHRRGLSDLPGRQPDLQRHSEAARTMVLIVGTVTLVYGCDLRVRHRTTSRRCSPTPRSVRSATCSSPSVSAPVSTRSASSICSATGSSRRRSSSRPVRSCTR